MVKTGLYLVAFAGLMTLVGCSCCGAGRTHEQTTVACCGDRAHGMAAEPCPAHPEKVEPCPERRAQACPSCPPSAGRTEAYGTTETSAYIGPSVRSERCFCQSQDVAPMSPLWGYQTRPGINKYQTFYQEFQTGDYFNYVPCPTNNQVASNPPAPSNYSFSSRF